MTLKQEIGQHAENAACQYLCQRGLTLVRRHYLCKMGEIDLIMRDNNVMVFVEVRYRRSACYGSAAESVTPLKQRKLIKTAGHYLQSSRVSSRCRFDVVAVTSGLADALNIQWIKDAFRVEY